MPLKPNQYTVKDQENLKNLKEAAKSTGAAWFVYSPATSAEKRLLVMGKGSVAPKELLATLNEANLKVFTGTAEQVSLGGKIRRTFDPKGSSPPASGLFDTVSTFAQKGQASDLFPETEADILYDSKRMTNKPKGNDRPSSSQVPSSNGDTTPVETDEVQSPPPEQDSPEKQLAVRQRAEGRMREQRVEQLLRSAATNEDLKQFVSGWRKDCATLVKRLVDAADAGQPDEKAAKKLAELESEIRELVTAPPPKAPVKMKAVKVQDLENAVAQEMNEVLATWKTVEDPLAETQGSLSTLRDLMRRLKSWDAAKKDPRAHELFAYRKEVVDKSLIGLRKTYDSLVWKSVGSMSWSSDYDITVATKGGEHDTAVVKAFNGRIKATFGVQPGTLFDTNLYVRDYADVAGKDSGVNTKENVVKNAPKPKALTRMMQAGQDMGALMKQRRYMTAPAWEEYMRTTLGTIERDAVEQAGGTVEGQARKDLDTFLAKTKKQFEEADANYQIGQKRLEKRAADLVAKDKEKSAAKMRKQLAAALKVDPDGAKGGEALIQSFESAKDEKGMKAARRKFEELLGDVMAAALQVSSDESTTTSQDQSGAFDRAEALQELEDTLAEEDADSTLEASNELYLEGMDEVRRLEKEAQALLEEAEQKAEEAKTAQPVEGIDIKGMLESRAVIARQQAEAKLEVARTKAAEAIFFAAEAYHTQGAVEHIVAGIQGAKLTPQEEQQAKDDAKKEGLTTEEDISKFVAKRRDKKKDDALSGVDAWSVLQSFNENVGDFMKDMEHYGKPKARVVDDEDLVNLGKAFVKGSKYLERMFDCIELLKKKMGNEKALPFETALGGAADMQKKIANGVLMVRKGAQVPVDEQGEPLPPDQAEAEGYRYAEDQLEEIFGARGIESLETTVMRISREVNSWVRREIQKQEIQAGLGEEAMYFKAATGNKPSGL